MNGKILQQAITIGSNKAIIKEQIGGWKIEINRLKRKGVNSFSFHNRMIIGYLRSLMITMIAFIIGGVNGMFCFFENLSSPSPSQRNIFLVLTIDP